MDGIYGSLKTTYQHPSNVVTDLEKYLLTWSTITANVNQYRDVLLPGLREGSGRDSISPWVEAEDLHSR